MSDKKNLILLHGALGAAKEFDSLVPFLEKHFNVFRFDLHGHGASPITSEFSMELFSEELKEFIATNGLNKPQIFGYSMGGYVTYTLASRHPELIGDIMTLGTMLKWDPLRSKLEQSKMVPEKIEQKVPQFAAYLDGLHLDWKANMRYMSDLVYRLGNGGALRAENFSKITNKVYIGLGEMDEMVSCQETLEVDEWLPNSHYYKLPKSKHPLAQLDPQVLAEKIIAFLG